MMMNQCGYRSLRQVEVKSYADPRSGKTIANSNAECPPKIHKPNITTAALNFTLTWLESRGAVSEA